MNLKEALEYRRTCLIHEKPMMVAADHIGSSHLNVDDTGLVVRIGNPGPLMFKYNFDGSYKYYCSSHSPRKSAQEPFLLYAVCEACVDMLPERPEKAVPALDNILNRQYYYTITLTGQENGTYTTSLGSEIIRWHANDKFYHIVADLQNNKAFYATGSCEIGAKLNDVLRGFTILKLPNFNGRNIKTLDKYVEKMKLYNLFS